MCPIVDFQYGIFLAGWDGVVIPPNAKFWQLDDSKKLKILGTFGNAQAWMHAINAIDLLGDKADQEQRGVVEAVEDMLENPFLVNEEWVKYSAILKKLKDIRFQKLQRRTADRSLRSQVIERDHSTCHYCGTKLERKACRIDHIIPYSLGGLTELSNLVTACNPCNSRKSGRTLEEAGMTLLEALGV